MATGLGGSLCSLDGLPVQLSQTVHDLLLQLWGLVLTAVPAGTTRIS
jgi:hypothetical protein